MSPKLIKPDEQFYNMNKFINPNNNINSKNLDHYFENKHDINKSFKILNISNKTLQHDENIIKEINENKYVYKKYYNLSELSDPDNFLIFLNNINEKIKSLLKIPNNYKILWLQGNEEDNYKLIPQNIKHIFNNTKGCYYITGDTSKKAFYESKNYIESTGIYNIHNLPENFDFIYICSNEIYNGIEFRNNGLKFPNIENNNKLLIVDMTYDLFMKEINWSNIDICFSNTSINLGVNNLNLYIIKEYLYDKIIFNNNSPDKLKLIDNINYSDNKYIINNFQTINNILNYYIEDLKNIIQIDNVNQAKAHYIYDFLDNSKFFDSYIIDTKIRSNINILFKIKNGNNDINNKFIDHCYKHNIIGFYNDNLKISNNLLQISLYNNIYIDDVLYIVKVMKKFVEFLY